MRNQFIIEDRNLSLQMNQRKNEEIFQISDGCDNRR